MSPLLLLASIALAEDVYVASNVRGAEILVNGLPTGLVTPATVTGVAPGSVLLTVEDDCTRGEVLVDVKKGAPLTKVSVLAGEILASLTVTPVPVQASLELDGRPFPAGPGVPVSLDCGTHTIRASLDGYVPAVLTLDVEKGEELMVPITLQKLGLGSIDLSVQPRNGTLLLDGKAVGTDAVSLPSVYAGPHVIAAEMDGYQSARKRILVEDGDALAFHFVLERSGARHKNSAVTQIGGRKVATTEVVEGASQDKAAEAERKERDAAAAEEARIRAEEEARAEVARKEAEDTRRAEEARAAEAAREAEEAREAEAARVATAKATEDARRAREAEAEARRAEEAREAEEAEAERRAAEEAEAERRAAEEAEAERRAEAQRKAEDAARKAEAVRKAEDAARKAETARRTEETSRTVRPKSGGNGGTITGVSLLGGGAVLGAGTVFMWDRTRQAYVAYEAKVAAAESANDQRLNEKAQQYYDQNVMPRATAMWAAGAGTAALLGAGTLVLVLDGGGPSFAPLDGGGVLLWNGRF